MDSGHPQEPTSTTEPTLGAICVAGPLFPGHRLAQGAVKAPSGPEAQHTSASLTLVGASSLGEQLRAEPTWAQEGRKCAPVSEARGTSAHRPRSTRVRNAAELVGFSRSPGMSCPSDMRGRRAHKPDPRQKHILWYQSPADPCHSPEQKSFVSRPPARKAWLASPYILQFLGASPYIPQFLWERNRAEPRHGQAASLLPVVYPREERHLHGNMSHGPECFCGPALNEFCTNPPEKPSPSRPELITFACTYSTGSLGWPGAKFLM